MQRDTATRAEEHANSEISQWKEPLINTAALARCTDGARMGELFQQFVAKDGKPLKRLVSWSSALHRAKAAVLMRLFLLRLVESS